MGSIPKSHGPDPSNSIPVLDLSLASDPKQKPQLLKQLHSALFEVGFLFIVNHGVERQTIDNLTDLLPSLFALLDSEKASLRKLNSPHFLGYSGFAEETTLGKQDLREQFDFATELPIVYQESKSDSKSVSSKDRDFSKLYWRLRGPNQWPQEPSLPGFCKAFKEYHDAVQELSYRFVHLIEESFGIPVGTFDHFLEELSQTVIPKTHEHFCRHNIASNFSDILHLQELGNEPGLEVMSASGEWIPATPIDGSFVVNFGNAFDAATEGAVKATIHRVIAPGPDSPVRYSIPFFQGLPLDMTVSDVQDYIPKVVRQLRKDSGKPHDGVSSFLDPRWDSLGESQLRKWIRSHKDVGLKWYGQDAVDYYTSAD